MVVKKVALGIGVVIGLVAVARARLVAVTVQGESMAPTLRTGQRILVRRTRSVHRGQIVVLANPSESVRVGASPAWLVKRAAAVAGDPVPDGVPETGPVPAGKLVLIGDNTEPGYDSRRIGYFEATTLLGVMIRPLG